MNTIMEEVRLTNYMVVGEVRKEERPRGPYRSFALWAKGRRKRFCYCFGDAATAVDNLKLKDGSCVTVHAVIDTVVDKTKDGKEVLKEYCNVKLIFISGEPYKKEKPSNDEKKEEKPVLQDNLD